MKRKKKKKKLSNRTMNLDMKQSIMNTLTMMLTKKKRNSTESKVLNNSSIMKLKGGNTLLNKFMKVLIIRVRKKLNLKLHTTDQIDSTEVATEVITTTEEEEVVTIEVAMRADPTMKKGASLLFREEKLEVVEVAIITTEGAEEVIMKEAKLTTETTETITIIISSTMTENHSSGDIITKRNTKRLSIILLTWRKMALK